MPDLSADVKLCSLGKSHISATLCKISEKIDPEAHDAHPQPDDQFWLDRTQDWRTRFMKHIRTRLGNREEGGMDVSLGQCRGEINDAELQAFQEVHGKLLDDLVKEWGVEEKWSKEARLEAVHAWHSLPGP